MTHALQVKAARPSPRSVEIRQALEQDVAALVELENASFSSDRLSPRRLKYWVQANNRIFLVAERDGRLLGYCLILLLRGTRLARLYSIATAAEARGLGIGRRLLSSGEEQASDRGRLYMRLEVAQNNAPAIQLYKSMGYSVFGAYHDYYEDHQDALRMHKRIRYIPQNLLTRQTPWYQQTTEFTCGPASLMMALGSLDEHYRLDQIEELNIWRQATTIFMTSGHGGCHPIGLALAARSRGFKATVYLNHELPCFLEGVRQPAKKAILEVVDRDFNVKARKEGVKIRWEDISQKQIQRHLDAGGAVIMLISTYRLDGKKAPHWVTITGMDDVCLYMHDPDPDSTGSSQVSIDCQHVPIARSDFVRMSAFGRQKLRTAVLLSK